MGYFKKTLADPFEEDTSNSLADFLQVTGKSRVFTTLSCVPPTGKEVRTEMLTAGVCPIFLCRDKFYKEDSYIPNKKE